MLNLPSIKDFDFVDMEENDLGHEESKIGSSFDRDHKVIVNVTAPAEQENL